MTRVDHVPVETLADHAEGLLTELEARRVTRHLRGCADCRDTTGLLGSVSRMLAAADPGVMPAWYVTRINADLARLAVTEPVTPGPPPARSGPRAVTAGAPGRTLVTGARRVSIVAAAVILLAGGAVFGIRTVGDQGRVAEDPSPKPTGMYAAQMFALKNPARSRSAVPTAAPAAPRPRVTQSGSIYDEDNFATGVRRLLSRSDPDVGASAADLTDRVRRCAARVGRRAIAGDEGFWGRRPALVVIVESENPDQVTGYVFYGRCAGSGPVSTGESPWVQQADKPQK